MSVQEGVYEAAVRGRREFRQAYSEARAELTRVYDIIAGINDGVEVTDDGYARLASLNDRDLLQKLCDELGAQTYRPTPPVADRDSAL